MIFGSKKRIAELEAELTVVRAQYAHYHAQFIRLQLEWNKLVRRINALGGEEFLRGETRTERVRSEPAFDPQQLRRLIQLCHPDKHANSPLAVEMTAYLNKLKG